ncbi:MAG: carboxy-S-adenosyl-L-methionine synthase CmoA [Cereibacter sphaeroides]|uniref:Carboxy-S-adenosyl-L-methionine synthase n=1 Tax=Cereibacter sphaeroides TaxID=1063 RepID=A0A2W5U702_CERSP|nr:MAG: carboxy-S-adenosyl-L-methionine synthase CmoA [Cereibacter sphaeroides]
MTRDTVFARRQSFAFDGQVAEAFDDMVSRSVPLYAEMQRMVVDLAAAFAMPGSRVYDLGCSTGTTLAALEDALPETVGLVGIDQSAPMVEIARARARRSNIQMGDLASVNLTDASVVLLILTLQFVRPALRPAIVQRILDGLKPGGALVLVEKVVSPCQKLDQTFIDLYHDHKRRQGYSEAEIENKRRALENVLIPYRLEENLALLSGFAHVETFFRWHNFAGIVAVKADA